MFNYIAQYKILGIWMNIGLTRGHWFRDYCTQLDSFDEAKKRLEKHKIMMDQARQWPDKNIVNYEETNTGSYLKVSKHENKRNRNYNK